MLGAYIISPDKARCQYMQTVALQTSKLLLLRILQEYPAAAVLTRTLNSATPELVLLDMEDSQDALTCAQRIRTHSAKCAIFGLDTTGNGKLANTYDSLFQAIIPYPVSPEDLIAAVESCLLRIRVKTEPNLLAFLPAKAGSGASTLAWNTAARMGRERKVLLIEADLWSGGISFLLNVQLQGSLQQLLNKPDDFGSFLLRHYITPLGKVDALLSDRTLVLPQPDWETYFRLIDSMILRYNTTILDLPENPDPAQHQLLRRAGKVFVVASPDLVAVRLAERTLNMLAKSNVDSHNVFVLLNKCDKNDLAADQVEKFLGVPIAASFPADAWSLSPTIGTGEILQWDTSLGRAIRKFVDKQTGQPEVEEKTETFGLKLRSLLGAR